MSAFGQHIIALLTALAVVVSSSRCLCAASAHTPVVTATVSTAISSEGADKHACCATKTAIGSEADTRTSSHQSSGPAAVADSTVVPAGDPATSHSHCPHCKVGQSSTLPEAKSTTDYSPVHLPVFDLPLLDIASVPAGAALRHVAADPPPLRGQLTLLSLHCSLLN